MLERMSHGQGKPTDGRNWPKAIGVGVWRRRSWEHLCIKWYRKLLHRNGHALAVQQTRQRGWHLGQNGLWRSGSRFAWWYFGRGLSPPRPETSSLPVAPYPKRSATFKQGYKWPTPAARKANTLCRSTLPPRFPEDMRIFFRPSRIETAGGQLRSCRSVAQPPFSAGGNQKRRPS